MPQPEVKRRLPVGAEVLPEGGVHFRVWAPRCRHVHVVLEGASEATLDLQPEKHGYFSGFAEKAGAGTLYRFQLDGNDKRSKQDLRPDPASRFQPEGPHGPSQVIDSSTFPWSDANWQGVHREGQVLYELHIGTFTREGTWKAAQGELKELAALGVTVLEVMPVAEFPGRFGWGYDGVDLFAPTRLYGEPDDFRRFVDRAHALGIGVILDVVYNHFGPDGCYLRDFSPHYFTNRYKTDWGEPINYDSADSGPVRDFIVANAGYWIAEYHLDGLRLDATQNIYDASAHHILAAIARRVREAAGRRATLLVAENEPQLVRLVQPQAQGGYGLDALWNDDFHHTAVVAVTGHNEAFFRDYNGTAQELVSTTKHGYLYQGQRSGWQKKRRGSRLGNVPLSALVTFLQNHDQVANSGRGERLHQLTSPGRYRAITALCLLGPGTPMLFQGQEFAASSPFVFFADHHEELAQLVKKGRAGFLSQFPSLTTPEMQAQLADPHAPETFERCKLDLSERQTHAAAYALHKDLLALRRTDPVFAARTSIDGAVFSEQAFVLRFTGASAEERLLLVNLGRDLHLQHAPEPLLAPPSGHGWTLLWSSEDPRYGGHGTPPVETEEEWSVPGESAVVLMPSPAPEESPDGGRD
ncbi:MAG TPA: malto-oligosyltrehalose trehalohydrolase [Gemmataceae bacterium]|nr:malto-oligosyltrehalose trehalohydrolase [Gemmataceae bacterium]